MKVNELIKLLEELPEQDKDISIRVDGQIRTPSKDLILSNFIGSYIIEEEPVFAISGYPRLSPTSDKL